MSIAEILIVVAILSIIMVVMIVGFKPSTQLGKSRDARRKADLQKLKNPLEDYYNDHKCYPPVSDLACNSTTFRPYVDRVPCDPETHSSYYYERPDCNSYRFYTELENISDPIIVEAGCSSGCGPAPNNWGVSSPNISLIPYSGDGGGGGGTCTQPGDAWWACGADKCCNNMGSVKPGGIPSYCNLPSCNGTCTQCPNNK